MDNSTYSEIGLTLAGIVLFGISGCHFCYNEAPGHTMQAPPIILTPDTHVSHVQNGTAPQRAMPPAGEPNILEPIPRARIGNPMPPLTPGVPLGAPEANGGPWLQGPVL